MDHMSPQTYRILKYVVGKFRLKSVLTEGSVVGNLGVLLLIIFFWGGDRQLLSCGNPPAGYLCH